PHQRPPTAGRVSGWSPGDGPTLDEAAELLESRELTIEGRLPWSSNLTFLVSIEGTGAEAGAETGPLQAVYKPHRGERSLWDFPDGLYRREVAAYALSEALGWGLVPPTVVRDDGPFGPGSVQLFVAADYEQHYFTLWEQGGREDELAAFCAFDVVANNADRKSGHVLLGADGRLWGIDHGLCFHVQHKLRTVIWDLAGEEVPAALLADVGRLASAGPPPSITDQLSQAEADALVDRAARLVAEGRFPEPVGERPPYPWPLL
ncbi:MAG TPA: SCO1664 family protein, partial [Acidimicrobiales bacterium]|nr:SCO1664 family protein [Acidimicrobiales bacterium]